MKQMNIFNLFIGIHDYLEEKRRKKRVSSLKKQIEGNDEIQKFSKKMQQKKKSNKRDV